MKYRVIIYTEYPDPDLGDWTERDRFSLFAEDRQGVKEKVRRSKNWHDISIAFPESRLHMLIIPHTNDQEVEARS